MIISGCGLPTSTLIYRKTYQETYHSWFFLKTELKNILNLTCKDKISL